MEASMKTNSFLPVGYPRSQKTALFLKKKGYSQQSIYEITGLSAQEILRLELVLAVERDFKSKQDN